MPNYTWHRGQVKLGPGMMLAFRKGHGYYAKPKHPAPTLQQQALKQAQVAEQPNIDAITGDQQQYDKESAQQQTAARNWAAALAQLMGSAAPDTQKAYQNAAAGDASFAKGFSSDLASTAAADNSNISDILSKAGISGAPAATALSHIGDAGDVLYGLAGQQPASGLEREGAAFTAAAAQAPKEAIGLGEQNVMSLLNSQHNQDQQFEQQLQEERDKIPAAAQSILQQMLSRKQQEESLRIQEGYLGNSTRSATANATGVDPVTGSPKPGYYVTKGGKVLPDGYVMKNGHPVRQSTAAGKKYDFNGAMSAANSKIYESAKGMVKTVKNTGPLAGLPGHPSTKTQAPPFAQAAKEMFNEYKYLLREVPRSQRPAAKRVLNNTIREALVAAGIRPTRRAHRNSAFDNTSEHQQADRNQGRPPRRK